VSEASVTEEIHRLIDEKIAGGVIVNVDWIAQEILASKDKIEGDDAAFYRVCTFREICRQAKRAIGKYAPDDATPEQLVLPGFKHLCRAYPVTRDGDVRLVPVSLCTDDELAERARQLDEMAKGCRAHAREIREYVRARSVAEAA